MRHLGVYPRVCGGTARIGDAGAEFLGLSPRVRGNQPLMAELGDAGGSIPACAGEPSSASTARDGAGVYPRVCGGTASAAPRVPRGSGLSPRVRGNPAQGGGAGGAHGSIPACAGEPTTTSRRSCSHEVYPRVCGGTVAASPMTGVDVGLSPRVRGNRERGHDRARRVGSIPACAGEPARRPRPGSARGVYPRVCGGTRLPPQVRTISPGLSPRVRGNRDELGEGAVRAGSIPACAGEPSRCGGPSPPTRVYPRVCGGTASISIPSW